MSLILYIQNLKFMEAMVFEIAGVGEGERRPGRPPLVKGVGTKRLGKGLKLIASFSTVHSSYA